MLIGGILLAIYIRNHRKRRSKKRVKEIDTNVKYYSDRLIQNKPNQRTRSLQAKEEPQSKGYTAEKKSSEGKKTTESSRVAGSERRVDAPRLRSNVKQTQEQSGLRLSGGRNA